MNSHHEFLNSFRTNLREADAEIAALGEELAELAKSPGRNDVGACIVTCQELANVYGLRGVFRVLDSDEFRGWNDIHKSYRFLAESICGRLSVQFANSTSLDNDTMSELLMASVVFEKDEATSQILAIANDPSRYGINDDYSDSDFAMFGKAMMSLLQGERPSLEGSNAFSVLLKPGSLDELQVALKEYEPVRIGLTRDDEDGYHHFENLPIAIFPIEVLAVLKLRNWNLRVDHESLPVFFATPLMNPPRGSTCESSKSLSASQCMFSRHDAENFSF